ncbi:MAG TPA: hypothetical protein VG734_20230 [Lacunisphaera sp.]|nr:hypothetical protein [Lacunisphaera sp.]
MKHSLLVSFLGGLALLPAAVLAQSTSTAPSVTYPAPNANVSITTDAQGNRIGANIGTVIPEDADGDGRISRSEFTMSSTLAHQQEKDAANTVKEKAELNLRERTNALELFNDLDRDKDGYLSGNELDTHSRMKATGPRR